MCLYIYCLYIRMNVSRYICAYLWCLYAYLCIRHKYVYMLICVKVLVNKMCVVWLCVGLACTSVIFSRRSMWTKWLAHPSIRIAFISPTTCSLNNSNKIRTLANLIHLWVSSCQLSNLLSHLCLIRQPFLCLSLTHFHS